MEDLNQLYFEQQVALIHAASSSGAACRNHHARIAKAYGERIKHFRRIKMMCKAAA